MLNDKEVAAKKKEEVLVDSEEKISFRFSFMKNFKEVMSEVTFLEGLKSSPYFLVRMCFYLVFSVWFIVVAIGMFFVWLISLLLL